MKRNEMADKIYDILEKRWQNQFEDLCDSEWKDFLSKHGIDLRVYDVDHAFVMFEDMFRLLNERKDAFFLKDPLRESEGIDAAGWLVMLVVPDKLAEKIIVLCDLP